MVNIKLTADQIDSMGKALGTEKILGGILSELLCAISDKRKEASADAWDSLAVLAGYKDSYALREDGKEMLVNWSTNELQIQDNVEK